jgi:AAA15 family ATPase/GTPase
MKIKTIEINNYKAFYGEQKINVGGKNLFIYGENGSGKSSLYYALKDFFQSSMEDINLNELENIFIEEDKKGNSYIKVTFNPPSELTSSLRIGEFPCRLLRTKNHHFASSVSLIFSG